MYYEVMYLGFEGLFMSIQAGQWGFIKNRPPSETGESELYINIIRKINRSQTEK